MTLEPMEKWRSSESVERLGMSFSDALFNRGRVERERRRAAKRAARQARWKQSATRKWMWRIIWFGIVLMVWVTIMNELGLAT